jgi:hypothetical protein
MNYFYVILVLIFIFSSLVYAKPKTKLLISASLGMALAVSKVSKPKEFAGEVLDSSQSQSQTSLMINSKIDEENDTNK